jgi:hypothetical protein
LISAVQDNKEQLVVVTEFSHVFFGSVYEMTVRGLWVIDRDSGINIFSKYYKEQGIQDELFSGYMSALTSFLGELSTDKEKLDKAMNLGSSYSLATEDMKLSVRGFENLMFVLAFDKTDDEETMNRVLRRLGEVFRAMYGARVKTDKKAPSTIDFKNFELVMDALIRSEAERVAGQRGKRRSGSKEPQLLPENVVSDLSYIKGVNVRMGSNQLKGFDENKDPGYPIEVTSLDKKITVNVLFKRFLDQGFSDWVRLIVEVLSKLNTLPDVGRLRAALLYVDNSLTRKPSTPDWYTLQLMLSGSIAAYGSEDDFAAKSKRSED